MKLYKIAGAPAGERFHSAKTGLKDFEEIELPKDGRAGMAKFLNDNEHELTVTEPHASKADYGGYAGTQLDPLEAAELRAVAAAGQSTTVSDDAPRSFTAGDVEEFLLFRATTAEAERIFSALGTRFKELVNDRG